MWIIAGTIPDPDFSLLVPEGPAPRSASLSEAGLHLPDGRTVPVERGTAALAATALQTCAALGCTPPALLLAGDTGSGSGSRRLYAWLEKALPALAPRGLTFHYLFPDVDWHNRLLLAVRELENAPLMVADAGFMYVAKMSGYADAYELFTPDVGELAFLADEKAPHPFYTRGFLLAEEQNIPVLLAKQIILGVGLGLAIGWAAGRLIERAHATAEGAQTIYLFAVAIVAYALPSYLGGNGFLAVYLAGIVLGASDITGKVEMAHFFDTLTEMAEMTIFFLLGLLVTPARLPQMLLPGLALMAFMLFVSRPIAVGVLLAPFKTNPRQVALVSWAGLRGAASVVFSLFAVVAGVPGGHDLFDLVFAIAVSSIVVQGSLLPAVAKKLDMIDATGDVRRTFNDYRDEDGMSFVKLKVGAGHPFAGRSLADIGSATNMLVVLVLRDGAHPVLPNGDTVIEEGDLLVMAAPTFEERAEVTLREVTVTPHGHLAGQRLRDVPQGKHPFIVVMLKREGQTIIPDGNTLIYAGDEAVIATLAS